MNEKKEDFPIKIDEILAKINQIKDKKIEEPKVDEIKKEEIKNNEINNIILNEENKEIKTQIEKYFRSFYNRFRKNSS